MPRNNLGQVNNLIFPLFFFGSVPTKQNGNDHPTFKYDAAVAAGPDIVDDPQHGSHNKSDAKGCSRQSKERERQDHARHDRQNGNKGCRLRQDSHSDRNTPNDQNPDPGSAVERDCDSNKPNEVGNDRKVKTQQKKVYDVAEPVRQRNHLKLFFARLTHRPQSANRSQNAESLSQYLCVHVHDPNRLNRQSIRKTAAW